MSDILVIEDDPLLSEMLCDSLRQMGYSAHNTNTLKETHFYLNQAEPSLILLDAYLPDGEGMQALPSLREVCPVVMMTAYGSVRSAVAAMQAGAAEYLLKPMNLDELEVVVQRVLQNRTLEQDYHFYKKQCKRQNRNNKLTVGNSKALQQVQQLIQAVAPTDVSVLIQGESGTGKELAAMEVHKNSTRRDRNFVALDCCTLQEKLFESELFGHERGAFTGADRQKKGLIENAEAGTLFLDEIGEIDATIQAKLLRVLETGQFRRLGGTKDLVADVRIVAATNRDLEQMARGGQFRSDLYYRLSAFVVTLPPLRERREDIASLVQHFVNNHSFSRRIDKQFSKVALQQLVEYDWPGNIRELRNIVERAIILSGDQQIITPQHLSFCANFLQSHARSTVQLNFEEEPSLSDIERDYFQLLMKKYSGHRSKVAAVMGVSERHVYRLLKKYANEDNALLSLSEGKGD